MAFNFKEAVEHARTPEGKAEDFLREVLNIIKPISTNSTDKLSFRLVSDNSFYSIGCVNGVRNVIHKISVPSSEQATLIFEAIEQQLTREGYCPEYPDSDENFWLRSFQIEY